MNQTKLAAIGLFYTTLLKSGDMLNRENIGFALNQTQEAVKGWYMFRPDPEVVKAVDTHATTLATEAARLDKTIADLTEQLVRERDEWNDLVNGMAEQEEAAEAIQEAAEAIQEAAEAVEPPPEG